MRLQINDRSRQDFNGIIRALSRAVSASTLSAKRRACFVRVKGDDSDLFLIEHLELPGSS